MATVFTGAGTITQMGNIYENNGLAITTSATYVANGCGGWANQYVTDSGDPANQVEQALLVSAFLSGKQVILALNGCNVSGAPIIRVVAVQP